MSSSPVAVEPPPKSASDKREFSLRERILLSLISWAGYLVITLIGPTLRYSLSWEEESSPPGTIFEKPVIYSFWHRAVFPAAWMWRKLCIAVMVSRSFDGEYIARIIEKLGFVAVRGSSSRGATGALLGMKGVLEQGESVAFTIDGPKGPRYVAKMGAVLLAKKSGHPIVPVTMALDRFWTTPSWDLFQIPKPFTRARVYVAPPIYVPADADDDLLAAKRDELQQTLDDLNHQSEEWRSSLRQKSV